MNYDLFRNKPIVPPDEDKLALELRERDRDASDLAKVIQAATGLDARKADHIARGFLGEAGNMAATLLDFGMMDRKASEGEDPGREPSQTRKLNALFGVFAQSPASSAPAVQWVLDNSAQSGSNANPLGELLDAYYESEDPSRRDAAARELRRAAEELKAEAEAAAKGAKDELSRLEAIAEVMKDSPYKRKREKKGASAIDLVGGEHKGGFSITGGSSKEGFSITGK